ncbi:MAG: DUF2851 family protein [Bacteroidales bacterium]|nr:DUF2851 family protein [Bacteroidales bacterium]MBN2758829.1 DUF2851 family protein [Bacteroidales bacterium]
MMNENFLQFVWKYQLFEKQSLEIDGKSVEIIHQGTLNTDAGPDFFNAKIKIDETLWAGNVEIEIKSSNWYLHKHNDNEVFNNVVLQVVYINDNQNILNSKGIKVPTLKLNINENLIDKYKELEKSVNWIACQNDFNKVNEIKLRMWLSNILVERLQAKSNYILNKLKENKNDWAETFYQILARGFGFKINKEPFEWLANSLPQKIIAKQKNSIMQIESLLFGQAGFLTNELEISYFKELKNEYNFFQKKYSLKPLEKYLWKFLRLRPSNFPSIRIAQFANLIFKSNSLFSQIIEIEKIEDLKKIFDVKASEFWETHYTFEKESPNKRKKLGKQSIDIILINTIIPFLYVYGQSTDNQQIKDRAISFLENIKAENNKIIRYFIDMGVRADNAFYSQALIQLKNEYCEKKNCVNCAVGTEILHQEINRIKINT